MNVTQPVLHLPCQPGRLVVRLVTEMTVSDELCHRALLGHSDWHGGKVEGECLLVLQKMKDFNPPWNYVTL